MNFIKDQVTIEGASLNDEEIKAIIKNQENAYTRCPYCLHPQNTRDMVQFLPDGRASSARKCINCHVTMTKLASTIFLRGGREYGIWVGNESSNGFWKIINHDEWNKQFEFLVQAERINPKQFWGAYREIRPKCIR